GAADRIPVLRALAAHPRIAGAHRSRRAGAERRAGGGGRGARGRRRLRPGAPLRPPARRTVPAARRDGRPHPPHRGRHGHRRHALREPALHGGGGRGDRPARRRPAAAGHQPRVTGDGAARLRGLRLRAVGGQHRRRSRAGEDRAVPGRARGPGRGGRRPADDRWHPGAAGGPAAGARSARAHLVGVGHPRHRRVDGAAGDEPDELDAAGGGHRRAVRRAAGRADRALPHRVGGRRLGPGAADLGQPQRPADRQRRGPRLLRQRAVERGSGRHPRRGAGTVREELRGRARRAGRGAGQGRRRPRGRHPADHRAQHARRRVQRPAAREHHHARRPGDRLGAPSSPL
ncbi:MAG: Alkanal monooxygenase alpha chain, partial [uncultured Blastococcus sp.]